MHVTSLGLCPNKEITLSCGLVVGFADALSVAQYAVVPVSGNLTRVRGEVFICSRRIEVYDQNAPMNLVGVLDDGFARWWKLSTRGGVYRIRAYGDSYIANADGQTLGTPASVGGGSLALGSSLPLDVWTVDRPGYAAGGSLMQASNVAAFPSVATSLLGIEKPSSAGASPGLTMTPVPVAAQPISIYGSLALAFGDFSPGQADPLYIGIALSIDGLASNGQLPVGRVVLGNVANFAASYSAAAPTLPYCRAISFAIHCLSNVSEVGWYYPNGEAGTTAGFFSLLSLRVSPLLAGVQGNPPLAAADRVVGAGPMTLGSDSSLASAFGPGVAGVFSH